jgi:NAD+ diphosphatase
MRTATKRHETERSTVGPSCDHHTYPRISPAIITLVRKGRSRAPREQCEVSGRLLQHAAGFADIGESLEETLVREVREEVGVVVHNVRYFGSQPGRSRTR